jgi:WhiB family redox-sensing transcriptional regulator
MWRDTSAVSQSWMSRGACQREDPELFFPVTTGGTAIRQVTAAKAVCADCPVRAACLSFAVHTRQYGIWGGTTADERHVLGFRASLRSLG